MKLPEKTNVAVGRPEVKDVIDREGQTEKRGGGGVE